MTLKSSRLKLPFIAPAQALKYITFNTCMRDLDAIVQLSAIDISLEPPELPNEGERYIVQLGASGIWATHENCLAVFQDGTWSYFVAGSGWRCWIESKAALYCYHNNEWKSVFPDTVDNVSGVGINASPDLINRLNVKGEAALFDHDGAGHYVKINKKTSGDTASLLFQTDYFGHSEIGLSGDNDLHVKMSGDGENWLDALSVDATTGDVSVHTKLTQKGHAVLDEGNTSDILCLRGNLGSVDDLDNYVESGMWHQRLNSRAAAGLNYPAPKAGLLTVVGVSNMVYQTYRVYSAAGETYSDNQYTRGSYLGVWGSWRSVGN